MSIFGTILSKIMGHHDAAAVGSAPPDATSVAASAEPVSAFSDAPGMGAPAAPAPAMASAAAATPAVAAVDVGAVLTGMAGKAGQPLNWRTSIVDLLKLLGLDSSLEARKTLAGELHYTGDTNDSATMNVWLIKQVMTKLAENGGKVPDDLK